MSEDPVREGLRRAGIQVEPRPVGPIAQIVAGGLGSLGGQLLARAAGMGPIGVALAGIGGAIVGHLAATNRVTIEPPPAGEPGPGSPMAYSDRR